MRSPEEEALSAALRDSTASVDFDDVMLARVVSKGRRRQLRVRVAGTTLVVGAVAAVGATAVQVWDRPGDSSDNVAVPETSTPSTGPEAGMLEAFEKTRSVVAPLLAQNDSEYQEEQFHLALNYETGEAVLYLPFTDAVDAEPDPIDVEQLAADAIAAVEATPGAAPVVPVIGVALIDELDAVSVQLFATRAEWAPDPADVYWTIPETQNVAVGVGVAEPEVAANLPETMQLASGATATIRIEKSLPGELE